MEKIGSIIESLLLIDPRIGWPAHRPPIYEQCTHGWFFDSHINVLSLLIDEKLTGTIIELGSWLGRSAEYFVSVAPGATIFSVDIWDDEFIRNDPHYNGNDENMAILGVGPLYDRFLSNLWDKRALVTNGFKGVIPMKMDSIEALKLLSSGGDINAFLIYIDANHHFDAAYTDISTAIELFPNAHIVGDDWDYPDVKRAVIACGKKYHKEIYVDGNKCWTFSKDTCEKNKSKKRKSVHESQFPRAKHVLNTNASFTELLKAYNK